MFIKSLVTQNTNSGMLIIKYLINLILNVINIIFIIIFKMTIFSFQVRRFNDASIMISHLFMNKFYQIINRAIFTTPTVEILLMQVFLILNKM